MLQFKWFFCEIKAEPSAAWGYIAAMVLQFKVDTFFILLYKYSGGFFFLKNR